MVPAMADWVMELEIGGRVAGVDEAGRGPLAGPVVAAAVVLAPDAAPDGIDDSKKLTPERRRELAAAIRAAGHVGIGIAEPEEIDRLNILHATMAAMVRAVAALPEPPAVALVDGNRLPGLTCPAQAVVGGDTLCASIAAASIVAKAVRDALMTDACARWPGYAFSSHFGYATPAHRAALIRLGPSPIHRRSFAPVRDARAA
jgi:ribonuclease HII